MLKEYKLYKGKVKILFDVGTPDRPRHIFKDEKGERILSVTSATGIIDKSAALMGWTAKMMALYLLAEKEKGNKIITEELVNRAKKEYRRLKIEAADIGTEIHKWVSDWILKKNPEMPEDERVVNGITAFLEFQKEHKFKWLESERIVYSKKHNYAGFLDAIAIDGRRVLADFKSTNEKINPYTGEIIEVPIYPETAFQSAGYQLAYEEETGKKISHRIAIAFGKKTGAFNFEEFKENEKDKKVFLHCLGIKRRQEEMK